MSKRKHYPVIDSFVHGKYSGKNCSSTLQSVHKLQISDRNLFPLYLLHKLIALLLLLCRAIIPKLLQYEAETLPVGTFMQLCRIHKQEFENKSLCPVLCKSGHI